MQDKEYAETLALSSTAIKQFKTMRPIEWKKLWITKEKEQKQSVALSKGSLTDDLLFNPSIVEERYLMMEVKKPSDSVAFIIENVFDIDKNLDVLKVNITEAAKRVPMIGGGIGWGQGKGWGDERIFDTVLKDGQEYYDFLKTTNGKHVVGASEYMAALGMAEAMKKSEECKKYLDPTLNKFQFQIITDDNFPYKMKGCLDILHIDSKKRQIRIVDFKTADDAFYFIGNIYKFGYLEQITFYTKLVEDWRRKNIKKYKNYETLPPMNIVIDSRYNIPFFYEYSWKDINAAWGGYMRYGKMQNGIKDTISEIQWHILNDKWLYPKEIYENGCIKLDLINY